MPIPLGCWRVKKNSNWVFSFSLWDFKKPRFTFVVGALVFRLD